MERRCKSQQQQIFELKQELTNSTAELKMRLAQAEGNQLQMLIENAIFSCETQSIFPVCLTDRLETEKRRSKQALEDMDSLHQKEVLHLCCPNIRHLSAYL